MTVTKPGKDHHGTHVLDAALDLIADQGLAGLSFRSVARRAHVSPAQVQYYFRSKDDLLGAAFEHLSAGIEQRLAAVDPSGPPRDVLQRLLHVWLPFDEQRARAARVWLAFTAAAASSTLLGPRNTELDGQLRASLAALVRQARKDGALTRNAVPDIEASLLLAVVDGLTLQALAAPPANRAALLTDGLGQYLDRLFADGEQS